MSTTYAAVETGPYFKSWNVTSSADGDLSAQITHGFSVNYVGVAPKFVSFVQLEPEGYTHEWTLASITSEFINLNAVSATGAGLAGTPQLQVIAQLPNSLID